ncbi:GNAT family N-acetyltransferase [uncultured Thiothrix sp.]|uniref:GNAT family N-acetyltransferase n=1 Tax=uncultured Thiothrix sp. TaxID=223185 RepID=UPI002605A8A2|nr:GNAT family N-acetyltransferase [uncultured Thiothrix sp.]
MAFQIRAVDTLNQLQIAELSDLLIACVEAGASVSFMLPLPKAKAEAYWQEINTRLQQDERLVLIAETETGEILGSVQIVLSQPENQPHRADLSKMLVHPKARRQGIAAALLTAAEAGAKTQGKRLLVLDTANPEAERVYERGGWQRCGVVPDYALWPTGGFCDTTFFYKKL